MTSALPFGDALRHWRTARRRSQLELANAADVSQRHLSFLETGRSRPSREMVVHLAIALNLGLRDRNALLVSAGFAPAYTESALDSPDLDEVRGVLQQLLDAHGPFPAYVVDRQWDLVLANEAAMALTALFDPNRLITRVGPNVMRLLLHPDGARHAIANWPEVAEYTLRRLVREVVDRPGDTAAAALLAEVVGYEGVPDPDATPALPTGDELLIPVVVDLPSGDRVRLFTTIATIGAPFDITLEELRIETLLPADAASADLLRRL